MGKVIRFRKRWMGDIGHRHFVAYPKISKRPKGTCGKCGRPTRRSSVTGVLHANCYICRRLMMVYGPNIEVTWVEE